MANLRAGILMKQRAAGEITAVKRPGSVAHLLSTLFQYRYFYLILIPAIAYYIIFAYVPMYGSILAFKDFDVRGGILGSPWTTHNGFGHFYDMFRNSDFNSALRNTVLISVGRLVIEFPLPILLALLLNEVVRRRYKGFLQTVFTFPHFISWVVIGGIFLTMFGDSGLVNQVIVVLGGHKTNVLTNPSTYRMFLYFSDGWKESGWSSIIYLASISSINPELYESAGMDGANRLQLAWYVTLPSILSVIGILFVLQVANLMNGSTNFGGGFDQIFNLYNPAVYSTAEIIDTYIYRRTFFTGLDWGSATAIGLFKSLINFALLIVANQVVKKTTGHGIY